jgi:hypothetical protein
MKAAAPLTALSILLAGIVLTTLLTPTTIEATIITVRADSTGDYIAIFQAAAASSPGDTIEVGPGTYPHATIWVEHSLTILSMDGADSTILDGYPTRRLMRVTGTATDALVDGFTFANGVGWAGGIIVLDRARVTVRNCDFERNYNAVVVGADSYGFFENCTFDNNRAPTAASALYVSGSGALAEVQNCVFKDNTLASWGGAIAVVNGGSLNLMDCDLISNYATDVGGAISAGDAMIHIEGCFFGGNRSADFGVISCNYRTSGTLIGNTFHSNANTTGGSAAIGAGPTAVVRNIFSNQGNAYAITGGSTRSCNVYWANANGPILGGELAPDEVQADPLYCEGDLTISSLSPAAPVNSPCQQLIGAREIGCAPGTDPSMTVNPDTLALELSEGDSAQETIVIANAGGSDLNWQIDPSPPHWIGVEPLAGILQPGYFDTLALIISTSSLGGGVHHHPLVIASNDPENPAETVEIFLTVIPGPHIAVSDTTILFPKLYLGTSDTMSILIYNVGGQALSGSAAVDDPNFTPLETVFTIASGDSLLEEIVFEPLSQGIHTGTLTLASNDANGDTMTLLLQGWAFDLSTLTVLPDSIIRSVPPGGVAHFPLTVANAGVLSAPVKFRTIFSSLPFSTTAARSPRSPPTSRDPPCQPWESAESTALSHSDEEGFVSNTARVERLIDSTLLRGPPKTDFYDGFEEGVLIGWQDGGVSGIKEVTSQSAAEGSFSYRETSSSAGHHDGVYWKFGPIKPRELSFWIRSGSESTLDSYFTIRDSQFREVIFFLTLDNGMFYVNGNVGGHTTYPYTAGLWYHIALQNINFGNGTFDYVVDDSLIQADISFRNASVVKDFDRVDLYNYESGAQGWWDEILISPAPDGRWLTMSPWMGDVPAHQSRGFDVVLNASDLTSGTYNGVVIIKAVSPVQTLTLDSVFVELTVDVTASGVHDQDALPTAYALKQNFPNPFNPRTTITYELPRRSDVRLTVYDVKGRRIRDLVRKTQQRGRYRAEWHGDNSAGNPVSSGIYFYRLVAGDFVRTRKMAFLK